MSFNSINMSFNSLPYETQFKYLANLPLQDTINYCKTGSTAYIICQTDAFWKYKARKTFGIDLDVIDYDKSGAQKYKKLEDLINNGEIQDVMRDHYFDALLRNKMDIVKILQRYYDPNEDYSEYLDDWLHQWDFEADPQKLKLLAAAGVSFDRFH